MNPEELLQKIEKLEQDNQNKREVMSLVAHELRTSLTAQKWMLSMFLDSDFGPITDEQKNALTQGFSQNEHLIEIVTDLINFSQNDDMHISYNIVEANLISVVDSIVTEFSSESFKRGVPILFTKPQKEITAHIDIDKIKILLENLFSNALKYSNKGEGVEVALTQDAKNINIIVRDHGIGIPEKEQEQLFGKFFRATNAKEKESVGSGLGLYTAYMIAKHHNGTLLCHSKESIGTTFTLVLPSTVS